MPIKQYNYSVYDEQSGQWLYFRSTLPPKINKSKTGVPTPWQNIGIKLPEQAIPTGSGKYPVGYACAPGGVPLLDSQTDDSNLFEFSMFGALVLGFQWLLLRRPK
jgi:hypothetical protein